MQDSFPTEVISSIPIGSLAKKTKGKMPRNRDAHSREATSRENQEDMAHFKRVFEMQNKGKTFMPKEATPEGFVGMWVRKSVYGKDQFDNTQKRINEGWFPATSDKCPKVGFMNVYGDLIEDRSLLERNGLVWMVRPQWIHDMEMEYKKKKIDDTERFREAARVGFGNGGFATGRGTNGQTVTFASDAQAQYIAGMFNQ